MSGFFDDYGQYSTDVRLGNHTYIIGLKEKLPKITTTTNLFSGGMEKFKNEKKSFFEGRCHLLQSTCWLFSVPKFGP